MTKFVGTDDQLRPLAEPPDMPSASIEATDVQPAIAAARWRRLQGIVNTRLFGDEAPQIGRYRLLRSIGSGAMGVVFRAHDTELQRDVAIKLLSGDGNADQRRRLQREAQAMAKVRHPNVVGVYDVGQVDGEVYVAMELISGTTLRAWLEASARERTWRDTIAVFLAAARGLAAAHAAGLVHRDFKPENVLVAEDGRVCVVDFGLVSRGETHSPPLADAIAQAREGGEWIDVDASIAMAGTPAYMAPEQVAGRPVDARADVWSFCVALFEALYGARPFDREDVPSTLAAVVEGEMTWPRRPSQMPARIEKVLRRGLVADRDARALDMPTIVAELGAVLGARKRRWIALGSAFAAASFTALAVRAFATPGGGCDDVGLGSAWDDDRRASVVARLPAELVGPTTESLDRHAASWRSQLAATCGLAANDPEQLAQRLCLQQRRSELDATTTILTRAEGPILRNIDGLLVSLVDPATCADPGTRPLMPDDGAAPGVGQWRYELARARALWNAGDEPRARTIARDVYEAASAAEAWTVAADAGVLFGEIVFLALDDLAEHVPIIEGAREAATKVSHHGAAARASALLVHAPVEGGDLALLAGRFSGALAHANSSQDAEALALLATAVAMGWAPMYGLDEDEGAQLCARALAAATERLGSGHRLTRGLAHPALLSMRTSVPVEEALALLETTRAQWGEHGGETARAHLVVSASHAAQEQWTEAIVAQRRAIEILRPLHGSSSHTLARAMQRLMRLLLRADDLDGALAVGLQTLDETKDLTPDKRWFASGPGAVAYDLAVALLRTGRIEEARELAERSHATEPTPQCSVLLAEIRLRTHDVAGAHEAVEDAWRMVQDPLRTPESSGAELGRVRLARGLVFAAQDRPDDAASALHAAAPLLLSSMPREQLMMHTALLDAARSRGDVADVALQRERGLFVAGDVGPRDPARLAFDARLAHE